MKEADQHGLEQVRIAPGIEPSIGSDLDALLFLRGALRSVTDRLESLYLDGPPKKGRSSDDRDSYQNWLDETYGSIAHARAVLKATKDYAGMI